MATKLQQPPTLPPELPSGDDGHELRMSLLEHLEELRDRLFRAALGLIAGTVIGALFAGDIFKYLLQPYGRPAQVLDPTGSVTNYFRVALTFGAIIAIPLITYQLLLFILPGLTKREKRILLTALPAITLLFVVGVAFAWFLLLPTAIDFLANFHSDIFTTQWTADGYLGFVTSLLFWMGAAFETPLIFFVLSFLGFVNSPLLIKNWRIAIVGAAVIAAVITPTVDPVNMFLVMAPLLVLYVLSIFLTRIGSRLGSHTT